VSFSAVPLDSPAEIKRGRLSLAQKFAIAFLGLVAAVLVINGAIDMAFTYRDARAQAVQVQQEKADAASAQVVQFVTEIEQQLGWTTRAEWARISVEQRRYDFIRLMRQAAAITELVHVDGTGKEQLKLSRLEPDTITSGADLSADPRFVAAVRDKIYYGPVTFRRGSEPYMTIAMAHAGRNAGVTIAEVNLKLAWDVVTAIRVGETGYAFIIDPTGRLIAHPDMSLVLRNTNLTALPQVGEAMAGVKVASRVDTTKGPDGRDVLSAHAVVPKVGWSVFVELPAAEALGPVWAALYQTLALLALGVVLAGGAGTLLARRMVVPIRDLQAGAQRLGEGDLTQRIPVRSGDEIGALARRFNTMAGQIQESQETLERKVEDRTADLNEALEYQTATAKVLEVISRSPTELQPVLDTIIETALRLCQARYGLVLRLAADGLYHYAASAQVDPNFVDFVRQNPVAVGDGSAVGIVAAEKRTLHLPDALADPRFTDHRRQQQSKARTMLGVPLMRESSVVGVIFLAHVEVKPFTDRQIDLVTTFADQAVIAIENARLFEEVQARTRELQVSLDYQTATSEVLSVISRSTTDAQPVFDAIVRSAANLFAPWTANISIIRDGMLHFMASASAREDDENAIKQLVSTIYPLPLDPDRVPSARAIRDRTIVELVDTAVPDTPDASRRVQAATGFRSMTFVPLLREDVGVGTMILTNRDPGHRLSEKQKALIQTFADQAVIAIENARLFHETNEALEQQTATAEVLKVISRSAFNLPAVLKALLESAGKLCDAQVCLLFQLDGDVLRPGAHYGGTEQFVDFHARTPLAIDRTTIAGRTVIEKRTIHVPDIEADPEYKLQQSFRLGGWRSIIGVPLMREGVVIGTLALARVVKGPFTARQIELTESFADQAVIAIENSRLFEEVQAKTRELEASLEDLKAAQTRLIQSEKLASLGQLTAGIAHEIKNPLNFVNNFADLSVELVQEIEDAITSAGDTLDPKIKAEVDEVSAMLKGNLAKVVQHGRRADSIVKNMLAHSRESGGELRMVDLNATVDEALNLAYHGARAEKPGFNITLERHFDPAAGQVSLYPQEFTRVLLNLIGNGFHAANKKRLDGAPEGFEPTLSVTTAAFPNEIRIKVRDNGTGIPDAVKARIFEPFFTTKPTGEGTGLGLSLSHDIVVKQHGGKLDIVTAPGEFTEFTVTLPRKPISPEVHP
jgi:signal transduction histidine kinase